MYPKNILLFIVCCLLGLSNLSSQRIATPSAGNRGSWRILGITVAQFGADKDVISVKGPYDYFRKLKFKVSDAPLEIEKMVVAYDDGGLPENINLRFTVPQGGESRIIDLKGGKRKIKSVNFWYSTKGLLKGKAKVTLFGIK